MFASSGCIPILSYQSQQHGIVMVHCSRLAARICGVSIEKQVINLQELLFGARCDRQGGHESVEACSFVTAREANSTITIGGSDAGTGNDGGNPEAGLDGDCDSLNDHLDLSDIRLVDDASEQPDKLHEPDVSVNPDAGPEDLALIAEDLDGSKDQFLERKQLLENMMESLYEQHSKGAISLEDVNAAQTAANETLTNLDDAIARLDGMKARISGMKDLG